MKNYQCQTCGEGVLLEPREVEDIGPYCMEHLMQMEMSALNALADQARAQEQRLGTARQDDRRTAGTDL